MCGLTGFIQQPGGGADIELNRTVRLMTDRIRHRGPDSDGFWIDGDYGIAMGHRRLSVVDLSPAGHQPMISATGRFVIVYNGEVYNFQDIRAELEAKGATFSGHSDTEVILAAIEQWGVSKALQKFVGMFAFALWDRADRILFLARDQIGIKPLYWARQGQLFLFGSELKALRAHPLWKPSVDRNSISSYMRHNYIPAPHTIWQDTYKLVPGHMLVVRDGQEPESIPFWCLDDAVSNGHAHPFAGDDKEATEELNLILRDAVKRQMFADVPVGAFLSGGVDSSTVAALMQSQSNRPVRTFSIGFDEEGYNEAVHAKVVAQHLGTEHTELYVTQPEALSVIPHLSECYDEPFADSSQIPTFLISQLARQDVTVSLSGDGGDETFGGYNRYIYASKLFKQTHHMPSWLMKLLGHTALSVPAGGWDVIGRVIQAQKQPNQLGSKMNKFASALLASGNRDEDGFYRSLVSQWQTPNSVVVSGEEYKGIAWDTSVAERIPDFFRRMQYFDIQTYLPDDILTKVDRASMAHSLEVRVPLLDHRIVEFAKSLPMSMICRGGQGKWLLRQVLKRYVPDELIDRPKMGFGVPIDHWLRDGLSEWAGDLLSSSAIKKHGFLHPEPIEKAWAAHQSNEANLQHPLWTALMLQDWLEKQTVET